MTDERLKLLFGFVLIGLLIVLAAVIAIGNVRQETSFGLRDIIALIGPVIGFWAQSTFGKNGK